MLAALHRHLLPPPLPRTSAASGSAPSIGAAELDCGNIEVIDASDPTHIRLAIRPDVPCAREEGKEHFHWFFFAARGLRGPCVLSIENAGEASYAWKGWPSLLPGDPGFRARVSHDRRRWRALQSTSYDEGSGVLRIEHDAATAAHGAVYIAAFEPYDAADHAAFLSHITTPTPTLPHPLRHTVLGRSLDGAAIDLLSLEGGPLVVWVLGRQHPGESMGSFFIEGLVSKTFEALSCRKFVNLHEG